MLEDLEEIAEMAGTADTVVTTMEVVIKDSEIIILANLVETVVATAGLEEVPCAVEEEAVVIVIDPIKNPSSFQIIKYAPSFMFTSMLKSLPPLHPQDILPQS